MTETDDAKPDKSDLRPASIRRRAAARIAAVQTLYQQWGSGQPLTDVVVSFQNRFLPELLKEFKLTHLNDQHYTRLVFGVDARRANMDEHISAYLGQGWTMEKSTRLIVIFYGWQCWNLKTCLIFLREQLLLNIRLSLIAGKLILPISLPFLTALRTSFDPKSLLNGENPFRNIEKRRFFIAQT